MHTINEKSCLIYSTRKNERFAVKTSGKTSLLHNHNLVFIGSQKLELKLEVD